MLIKKGLTTRKQQKKPSKLTQSQGVWDILVHMHEIHETLNPLKV